jgi:hypothetical protein
MLKKVTSTRKVKRASPQSTPKPQVNIPASELESFTLAAAIEEARTSSTLEESEVESSSPRNKLFAIPSPLRKKATTQSAQSLADSSYNTANESAQNTPAVSYFDPNASDESSRDNDPEVTMPAVKKTTKAVVAPAAVPAVAAPAVATTTKKAPVKEEPHFDVSQQIYTQIKDIWAWGKTVPVVEALLGITESVAAKLLSMTFHTDLPAIDNDVAKPNLKKLDDQVVTPAIIAVWNVIGPAVSKGEEMIVKPVMKEVVPKILGVVGKKDPDASPNPEYTTAPLVN